MKKMIGTWSFLLGLVLAISTVFWELGEWTSQALIILGILVGIFHEIKDDFMRLGIIYLSLWAASDALQNLVAIGPILTEIVTAWVGFLGPVVLTAMLLWGSPYLLTRKKA